MLFLFSLVSLWLLFFFFIILESMLQFIKQLIKIFCTAFPTNLINYISDIIAEGFLLGISSSLNTLTWLLLFYDR